MNELSDETPQTSIKRVFDLAVPFVDPPFLGFKAAEQIAKLGDWQSLIFRRFDMLAIKNILDLHARV